MTKPGKSEPVPRYPLESLVLVPVRGWMMVLVWTILWYERSRPFLPLLLLIPAMTAGGTRITALREIAQGDPLRFEHLSGVRPTPLYSRAGLLRLLALNVILGLVTVIMHVEYGFPQTSKGQSPSVAIIFATVISLFVYRPFVRTLRYFISTTGITMRAWCVFSHPRSYCG